MEKVVNSDALESYFRMLESFKGPDFPAPVREHLVDLVIANSGEASSKAFDRLAKFPDQAKALAYIGDLVLQIQGNALYLDAIQKLGERQRDTDKWSDELWMRINTIIKEQPPESKIAYINALAKTAHQEAVSYLRDIYLLESDVRVKSAVRERLYVLANDKEKPDIAQVAQSIINEIGSST